MPLPSLLFHPGGDFTAALAGRWGAPSQGILPVTSGAAALWLALRGLHMLEPRRRRVAVPAWCCPSVPQAVHQAGLEPVPVDIDPSSLGYVPSALRKAGEGGFLAVVLVHYFGLPQPRPAGDWDGAAFLRDCAQDFEHRPGDGLPCFYSFGRGKALNAGHGGALCLPRESPWRAACARAWKHLPASRTHTLPKALAINLLSRPRLFWALARMPGLGLGKTEWHAQLETARLAEDFGSVGLACLETYAARREYYLRLVRAYREVIEAHGGDRVVLPARIPEDWLPARFPILVRDHGLRETLFRELNRRFGGVTRMYPAILSELPGAPAGFGAGCDFPGARRVAREILTLPVTAELIGKDADFLDALADLLDRGVTRRVRPSPVTEDPSWSPRPSGRRVR